MSKTIITIFGTIGNIRSNDAKTVTTMTVATKRQVQGQEQTTWHNVKCLGKNAEFAANNLKAGSAVEVQGHYEIEKWDDGKRQKPVIVGNVAFAPGYFSVNKAIVVGNLGKDVEVKVLPSGKTVVNLSLATTVYHKAGEQTHWVEVEGWGEKLAEVLQKHLKKGSALCVEGFLHYNQAEAGEAGKNTYGKVVLQEFHLVGKPRKSDEDQDQGQGQGQGQNQRQDEFPTNNDFDDDIPF